MVRHLIIVLFLFISAICFSQVEKDAGLWTTFTIQKKISKKIAVVIDQEFRMRENFQRINLFYTNVGVDYKINKNLKISPSYRAIQKIKFDMRVSHRHRLSLDIVAKKKFGRFILSERLRYQIEVQDFYSSNKGKLPEQFLRFKTDLKYDFDCKLIPFLSSELRYQLTAWRGDEPLYNFGFHRIRNIAGFEYEINKRNSFTAYYLVQSEYLISNRESIYIIGLAYTLNL